jgi:hypothetical protein
LRRAALARLSRTLFGLDFTAATVREAQQQQQQRQAVSSTCDATSAAMSADSYCAGGAAEAHGISPGSDSAARSCSHPLQQLFAWVLLPADFEVDAVPAGVSALVEACSRVLAFHTHAAASAATSDHAAAASDRPGSAPAGGAAGDDSVNTPQDEVEDEDGPAFVRGAAAAGSSSGSHPRKPQSGLSAGGGLLRGIAEGEEAGEEDEDEDEEGDDVDSSSGMREEGGRHNSARAAREAQRQRWHCLYLVACCLDTLLPPLLLRACDPSSETLRYAAVRMVRAVCVCVRVGMCRREGGVGRLAVGARQRFLRRHLLPANGLMFSGQVSFASSDAAPLIALRLCLLIASPYVAADRSPPVRRHCCERECLAGWARQRR